MKTMLLRNCFLAALFSSVLITSCTKENSETQLTAEEEQQAAVASTEGDAESEIIFNSVFDDVMGVNSEVGVGGVGIFGRTGNLNTNITDGRLQNSQVCFTVSVTPLVQGQAFPLRIVIDFGAGCTGPDGVTRSGRIITEYTGRLIIPGKSATTTFEGYKIDSFSVEGSFKITNSSTTNNDRQFTVNITDGKISKPNGSSFFKVSKCMDDLFRHPVNVLGYFKVLNTTLCLSTIYCIYGYLHFTHCIFFYPVI